MITYEQGRIIAGVMFFGGMVISLVGLLLMRKEATAFGSLCAVSGLFAWFWNGVGWYATN